MTHDNIEAILFFFIMAVWVLLVVPIVGYELTVKFSAYKPEPIIAFIYLIISILIHLIIAYFYTA
tara:strand:- start:431 stop:625 length:195 start_codon:yes stop_codon:yes gene_type:complete